MFEPRVMFERNILKNVSEEIGSLEKIREKYLKLMQEFHTFNDKIYF